MLKRHITFANAILDSIKTRMQKDKNVIIIGEGVTDPKAIFGTTKNLKKIFKKRVMDMPLSEAAVTGIIVGASMNGLRPILVHQRVDFTLLSMDQIINMAAKIHYISNGSFKVPIVIRAIIGRGWGQSAQHSQSLESIFAHIPGLKVVIPSNAYEAKGLLTSSILDDNPVIFLEHRWLHDTISNVPKRDYKIKLTEPNVELRGSDITIVANSLMVAEAKRAAHILNKLNIKCEVINLRILKPLNIKKITTSVKKTKRLLLIDTGWTEYGISAEILSKIIEKNKIKFLYNPKRIGTNNHPTPASRALIKNYYVSYKNICQEVAKMFQFNKIKRNKIKFLLKKEEANNEYFIDIPDKNFKGPF